MKQLLCRLPALIRAFCFRTLEHPWKETYLAPDASCGEQQCTRCGHKQHYRRDQGDKMSVKWLDGPLHAYWRAPVEKQKDDAERA